MKPFLHRMLYFAKAICIPLRFSLLSLRNAFAFSLSNEACFIFYVICSKTDGKTMVTKYKREQLSRVVTLALLPANFFQQMMKKNALFLLLTKTLAE